MSSSSAMPTAQKQQPEAPENYENSCVVCFRDVTIYSIGECDHAVCFECSTRMRVLCGQNECPICRQDVSKVFFTREKQPYRQLDTGRSGLYDKRYRICFVDLQVQNAFYKLLDNPCPKCPNRTFVSFDLLRRHVSKDHDLHYCDLCTENLKIFSFEKRCYTRQDLAKHKDKGDDKDTSHRGHPLCKYCDIRYLDRDELFRHLRREHFFCHFCDADGSNHFYGDYDSLREHFHQDHFLCEEGDCANEQFTCVFRTEIDLRVHISKHHSSSLGKIAAKQARTLEVEFSLVPRSRSGYNNSQGNGPGGGGGNYNNNGEGSSNYNSITQVPARVIDAQNEEEFPTLGNQSTNVPLIRPNVSLRTKTFKGGSLSRTNENFPALGGGGNVTNSVPSSSSSSNKFNQISASAVLKKQPQKDPFQTLNATQSAKTTTIHISNRPKTSANDFPALPGGNKNPTNPIAANASLMPQVNINRSALSSKHRSLVDELSIAPVTAGQQKTSAKLALISNAPEPAPSPKKTQPTKLKLKSEENFPTLGAPTVLSNSAGPTWLTATSKNNNKVESRKSKVAPAPNLSSNDSGQSKKEKKQKSNAETKSKTSNSNNVAENKQQNQKQQPQVAPQKSKSNSNVKENKSKEKNVNNSNNINGIVQIDENRKVKDKNVEEIVGKGDDFPTINNKSQPKLQNSAHWVLNPAAQPPPGFGGKQTQPPPGFNSVTLNSVARAPSNNLTFTNSMKESYNILPVRVYIPPPDMAKRNKVLMKSIQEAFKHQEAFDEFKRMSQMFRENTYFALPYYEHCEHALDSKFSQIFPELLSLLPDIGKQQELYLVYSQKMQKRGDGKSALSVCPNCKQVLLQQDVATHLQNHVIDQNFPSL